MKKTLVSSFAPPVDGGKIAAYREIAKTASEQIRDAMLSLCDMVETFYETPRSRMLGKPHPSGMGVVVPLEDAEIARIAHLVPSDTECDAIDDMFLAMPTGTEERLVNGVLETVIVNPDEFARRNAAFHLLWFARELTKDREPITNDLL